MNFTSQGKRRSSNAQLLLMSIHEQEKPKFDTAVLDRIALSKSDNDAPLVQEKRGRGRPRKIVELEVKTELKENDILDIKEKLKLLETITNGYKEIERLDKETQKNVEKLCAMIHNSK